MTTRATLIAVLTLIVLATVISVAAYPSLPDRVASHWGADDQVNGTMSRFWGVFLMPILSLAMLGLFLLIPGIDPLKANIARFRGTFNLFILFIIAFLLYIHMLTIAWNLGFQSFRMSTAVIPAVGLLLIFAGILIRSAKRNFFIGIRTPWTLASDRVWDQTHRLGAVLFMACGILAMLGIFLPGPAAYVLVIGPILISTLFLVVYSYWLWRGEQTSR